MKLTAYPAPFPTYYPQEGLVCMHGNRRFFFL